MSERVTYTYRCATHNFEVVAEESMVTCTASPARRVQGCRECTAAVELAFAQAEAQERSGG